MRYKMLALILALTVPSWAQTATPEAPSAPQQSTVPADKAKCSCCAKMAATDTKDAAACCSHHDMKSEAGKGMSCSGMGKDASCCGGKDAKSCAKNAKDKTASCCKDSCSKDKTASACCGGNCGKEGMLREEVREDREELLRRRPAQREGNGSNLRRDG